MPSDSLPSVGNRASRASSASAKTRAIALGSAIGSRSKRRPGGRQIENEASCSGRAANRCGPRLRIANSGASRRRSSIDQRRVAARRARPTKKTAARIKLIADLKFSGKDPVTFFAEILRDEGAPLDLRFAAAKELAPYMHPELCSIESRTGGKTHEDRLEELRRMAQDKG